MKICDKCKKRISFLGTYNFFRCNREYCYDCYCKKTREIAFIQFNVREVKDE